MRNLVAEQICETSGKTVIQRTYRHGDEYETISEIWTPKISWFHPPCVGFFRWAYNIRINMSNRIRVEETDITSYGHNGNITQIGIQFKQED